MASSSSLTSSIPKSFKYDVFISFRGEDTRKNFVDHLYQALDNKGINTYKDDVRLEIGKQISNELIRSIGDSRFFIIVFSKNYASSSWCLDELVKIMECHKTMEQTAYPVFYDVEPTEVRKQSGAVGEAFARHNNKESAGTWREALKEAASLSGWELNTSYGDESKLIQVIVHIFQKLCSSNHSDDGDLVGMESRIKDVEALLETSLNDVRMIGIWGMGGAGKTTLAKAVFDRLFFQFEGGSFVEYVREVSGPSLSGLKKLQKQILSDVLKDQCVTLSSVNDGKNMMKETMHRRKILLVLDDVDQIEQLEALAGELNWFKPGSRIIITTRDAQLLTAYKVKWIYDVKLLSDEESLSLFSRFAFKRDLPYEGYKELSLQVVRYAAGLPFTLKVLGSFLYGQNAPNFWIDALERLKRIPLKDTMEILELSYTGLEEDHKAMFLDVACLLKGWDKERAGRMLESCGFFAGYGLRVLEQKSMIITTKKFQAEFIDMHPHIEEMGKCIVRRVHPNKPSRHSRLWIQKEIEDILANELGSKAIEAIAVDSPVKRCSEIATKGFGSMKNLRLLCIESETDNDCAVRNDELILTFPSSLRFLSWLRYPYWSLPKTFLAYNLVVLELPHSRIERLWEGGERQVFHNLKYIDLSHSKLRTHDLGLTPNLETLNLSECHDLVELHLSIGCLKLRSIKVSHSKLMTLDLRLTPNLELLELKECHDLVELHMPVECLKLTSLNLSHLKLRNLDLNLTPNLEILSLEECHDLVEFNTRIERMVKLRSLKFSNLKLRSLDLQPLLNLELLKLKECHDLIELHMPVECLNLMYLELNHLKLKTFKLLLAPNLKVSKIEGCHDLVELDMPVECPKLFLVPIESEKPLLNEDLYNLPLMASSSSLTSSYHKSYKYDVFLSFGGGDTCNNFVDHLYHALVQKGIQTYRDEYKIYKGEKMDDVLIRSIEDSRSFIIVFSKNYASSSWCLDQLVKIMECNKMTKQIVHPVFYDVGPTEVCEQSGAFGEAFAIHNKEEAGKWRGALKEATYLPEWELKGIAYGNEAEFIRRISEDISLELRSFDQSYDGSLVGMETRLQDLESSLAIGVNDVRMIGIKGMGGAGKTTLARAIFDRVSIQFEAVSFVENVREISQSSLSGIRKLQKQILTDVLKDENITISSVHEGNCMLKTKLRNRKVLIVLDGVDQINLLRALAGEPNWFKPGSRIIITTRDEQLLKAQKVQEIHDVNLLTRSEATCLFSIYAFGTSVPIQGYQDLSREFVDYAAGLPLTIKVLGSFLCGLDINQWIDALERLKIIPLRKTIEILELSYTALEDDYKEAFLDVACFLKGWEQDKAIRLLESCGFHARIALRVLQQRSLITIDDDQVLGMHYHIEEMGKNIVRRSSPYEPNRHSRLWIQEEIEYILDSNMDTEATRAIIVNTPVKLTSKIVTEGFGRMKNLRALHLVCEVSDDSNVKFSQVRDNFPNALRFLSWVGYPHLFLPETFQANNLVRLQMSYSRIEKLWEGGDRKVLNNLKFLDLRFSRLGVLDACVTPNLERLDLEDCKHLEELHAPIGCLEKLVYLNLSGCKSVKSFLFIKQLKSLEVLCLNRLFLEAFPDILPRYPNNTLLELRFKYNYIEELPSSIANLEKLVYLDLCSCRKLRTLPQSICGLRNLRNLKLYGCILEELPEGIGSLECLEKLNVSLARIKHLPDSISKLKLLKTLNLSSCVNLEKLPQDLGQLECLENLILNECEQIRDIPASICKLRHLKYFSLLNCIELEKLPEELGLLECLEVLDVNGTRIKHLPHSISLLEGKFYESKSGLELRGRVSTSRTFEASTSCWIF